VGGITIYKTAKDNQVPINLLGNCLIFIITSGFTLNSNIDIIIKRGLAYYIYNVKVFMLKLDTVVVIILGY
jgi:hypothetical protein